MDFNHAMVYVASVPRALEFYTGKLGLSVVDSYPETYARLRFPEGNGTIALHRAESARDVVAPGIRLYFEVSDLDALCERLHKNGVTFTQLPQEMPWGWRHAYLNDPDGHEISLYRAGERRLRATR